MSKLKEYCINITDGEHGSVKEDLSGEYYFLNNNNITSNGIIIKPDDRRISITEFDRIHKRTKLAAGDIVIATCGTIGKCQVIRDEKINFDFSRSVGIIKCDSSRLLPDFLYYYLINPHTQNRIKKISEGGVQKHFYIGAMQEFDIEVPPIDIQRKIIAVLSAIDKKIQYNNKINDNLQHQLKLLYDYWFTQFDFPDENGKPYRASGGDMVWNDVLKKQIPSNWTVTTALDAGIYTSDFTANGSFAGLAENVKYNDGTPYAILVRVVDYNNNFAESDKFVYVNKHAYDYLKSCRLNGNEIIICNVGNVGVTFRCPILGMPMVLGPNGIVVNSEEYNDYLYMYYTSSEGQFKIQSISSGSIQKKFNKTDFRNMPLLLPPPDINNRFKEQYQQKKRMCDNIWHENRKLTALRDWLLPMLMNGQATISD